MIDNLNLLQANYTMNLKRNQEEFNQISLQNLFENYLQRFSKYSIDNFFSQTQISQIEDKYHLILDDKEEDMIMVLNRLDLINVMTNNSFGDKRIELVPRKIDIKKFNSYSENF